MTIDEQKIDIQQQIAKEQRKLRAYLRSRVKYAAEIAKSQGIIAELEAQLKNLK